MATIASDATNTMRIPQGLIRAARRTVTAIITVAKGNITGGLQELMPIFNQKLID
jgi:hypothetical protein